MNPGRIVMLVLGTLGALLGLGLLAGAAGVAWVNSQQREGVISQRRSNATGATTTL
jgi:hypothetical protein